VVVFAGAVPAQKTDDAAPANSDGYFVYNSPAGIFLYQLMGLKKSHIFVMGICHFFAL